MLLRPAARAFRSTFGVIVVVVAAGCLAPAATADYGPRPVTHYNCGGTPSAFGHYVPAGRHWGNNFTAQGQAITGGYLLIGANTDGQDHRARIGVYTGGPTPLTGELGAVIVDVNGYGGVSFTFPSPINVSPGQSLWIAATGVGDFTGYDQNNGGADGCFIGSLSGFNPPPPDGNAPSVSAFAFAPSAVDVSAQSRDVTVSVHLSDTPGGVRDPGDVVFSGPGSAAVSGHLSRVAGDENEGDYRTTMTIPKDAQPGTWSATLRGMTDNAGNVRPNGPPPAGSPTQLTVSSARPDSHAPTVSAFDFTPKDVQAGATVSMTITVADDVATDGPARLGFVGPGGRSVDAPTRPDQSHGGTYLADVQIPADAAGGTWTAQVIDFHDRAGNHGPEGAPPAGLPRELHVSPAAASSFRYAIANVSSPVNLRAGPSTATPRAGLLPGNAPIDIVCQAVGESINGSPIWDRLTSGAYVADWYTTTPVVGDYTPGIPHCEGAPEQAHPPAAGGRWAIAASTPVNLREGPGVGYNTVGSLGPGAHFDIACQTYGSYYLGSPIWDRLPDGRYIHDYFTTTPVFANFSPGIPVCDGTGARPPAPSGGGGGGGSSSGVSTGGGEVRADYVALGDSFSSGEGAPDDGPAGFSQGQACHRSVLGYPFRFARLVGADLGARFMACSGALTDDFYSRDSHGNPPQLNAIPPGGARLVTMTIGGNNMDFPGIMMDCIVYAGYDCINMHRNTTQRIADFGAILSNVYRVVKERTKGGRVVVVGYPKFFPTPARTCANAPGIGTPEEDWINDRVIQFNGVARAAAAQAGIDFVNPDGRAFINHDVCSGQAFINGIVPAYQEYSFHPNAAGHLAIAQALIDQGVR